MADLSIHLSKESRETPLHLCDPATTPRLLLLAIQIASRNSREPTICRRDAKQKTTDRPETLVKSDRRDFRKAGLAYQVGDRALRGSSCPSVGRPPKKWNDPRR